MEQIKPIRANTWKSELNSEAFISGLETAINFTSKHGNETSFNVNYYPIRNLFSYPFDINVGNKNSVSPFYPLNLPKTIEEYKKQIGLDLPHLRNEAWKERRKKLTPNQEFDEIRKGLDWMEKWNLENCSQAIRIHYPQTKDWTSRLEELGSIAENSEGEWGYTAIDVHTHPSGYMVPSTNDLSHLNKLRVINESFFKDYKDIPKRMIPNPILLIAGTKVREGYRKYNPLLIIQEKTKTPLPSETDFKALSAGFCELLKPLKFLMNCISGISCDETESEKNARENYNILKARYYLSSKEVIPEGKWGTLCEKV